MFSEKLVGIAATAYHLPPALSIAEYAASTGMADVTRVYYEEMQGLRVVHVVQEETLLELAAKAVRKLFEVAPILGSQIDALIVYHTFYALSLEPQTFVSALQERTGLTNSVGLSVSGQNCASPISALRIARNMIVTGSANSVLLVGVDYFLGSRRTEIQDITIQGEGASACLVTGSCQRNQILGITNVVDGSFYKGVTGCKEEQKRFDLVYHLTLRRALRELITPLSITFDEIRLIIPHNINMPSWTRMLKILKQPDSKLFSRNIPRHGHVCGSDLIINLHDATLGGDLQPGDYAILATVGLGAGWGCAVVRH